MKKLLLLSACISSLGAFAQSTVVRTPQPKKVVLEEFTGINCQYCPDGHRIANDMVAANPGNIFLINIHSGGFATPGAGQPDYRTTPGDAIDGAAGITGYPSGSINRASSPWGQGRNLWGSLANSITSQTSPVNVSVKAFVDIATRTLTTEVEVYYTANGPAPTNYITIALTQDDILGPQIDGGNYNPTNWVDGKYKHNHVLRQMITAGNFGEAIDTTTSGHYSYRKYTTVIPANYKGVEAVLNKMNVVAFVAQGNNNILSAASAKVDFDAALKTDLSVLNQTVAPSMCAASVNPKVEVTNALTQSISSFDITATVNGVAYKKTIAQTLAAGAKVTVDWGVIPFTSGGNYSVSIGNLANILGATSNQLVDIEDANNTINMSGTSFTEAPVPDNKIWCGFETVKNVAYDQSQNPNFKVLTNSGTINYGCYSKSAMLFYLHSSWGVEGKPGHILLGQVDLTQTPAPGMSYVYAYSDGGLGGTPPTVAVNISKDCGATWTKVSDITCVETGQPTDPTKLYAPKSTDYKMVKINLDAFKTQKVLAKISVTPGSGGNAFFIDEIGINSYAKLAVKEVSTVNFELFPNPAAETVTLNLPEIDNASYTITDISGKQLKSASIQSLETEINTDELKNGVYFIEITNGGAAATQKLVISK